VEGVRALSPKATRETAALARARGGAMEGYFETMKIHVDENIPLGRETFGAYGEVVRFAGRGLQRADLMGTDALMVRSVTPVNAQLLEGTPVRFVGTATIGTDHVDLAYLARKGIGFSSAPGSNANSVAEYVTSALLYLRQEKGFRFEGGTLGLVGWGNVGRQVEKKAAALGMRVLRCDPPLADAAAAGTAGLQAGPSADPAFFTALPDLLAQSDVVSLHVPLVTEGPHPTRNLADTSFFAALSKPVVLFNTCRGDVMDEAALRAALGAGKVRHLVLDVFAGEPRIDPALAAAADLVSPHIAGYSLEGKLNGTAQIAEAFRRHFSLPTPRNRHGPSLRNRKSPGSIPRVTPRSPLPHRATKPIGASSAAASTPPTTYARTTGACGTPCWARTPARPSTACARNTRSGTSSPPIGSPGSRRKSGNSGPGSPISASGNTQIPPIASPAARRRLSSPPLEKLLSVEICSACQYLSNSAF
jgi:erythronate-4-phosphate dehydrogenase